MSGQGQLTITPFWPRIGFERLTLGRRPFGLRSGVNRFLARTESRRSALLLVVGYVRYTLGSGLVDIGPLCNDVTPYEGGN